MTAAGSSSAVSLRLSDFPIPAGVLPDATWTPQMCELARLVGARPTLVMCDTYGGQTIYVPSGSRRSERSGPIVGLFELLGADGAAMLVKAIGGSHLTVPIASAALRRARRGAVLAHARAGALTISQAAAILGCTRNFAGRLLNHTHEGVGIQLEPLPEPRERRLLTEAAAIAARELGAAAVDPSIVRRVTTGIARLAA